MVKKHLREDTEGMIWLCNIIWLKTGFEILKWAPLEKFMKNVDDPHQLNQ